MKNIICKLTVFGVFLFTSTYSYASNVVVIVNSLNKEPISLADIRNIYNDKVITWKNGNRIDVYNLPVASPARELFSRKTLGVSAQEAAAAESNRSITNTIRNPQKVKRERLVISIVSKRPNAIGYASETAIQGKTGIRVISTITP